jgi:sigma-B regulation protein RsbU (phosphoserine phosphatase)
MPSALQNFESAVFSTFRRPPPKGWVHRSAFWLFLAYLLCWVGGVIPAAPGGVFRVLSRLILFPLFLVCAILFLRWLAARVLWKVRNRLIVTYVLMGLAPLVLFATLTLLVASTLAGQFAAFAATSAFQAELADLRTEDRAFALQVAQAMAAHPKAGFVDVSSSLPEPASGRKPLFSAFSRGRELRLSQNEAGQALVRSIPAWAGSGFQGVVVDGNALYMRAVDSESVLGGDAVVVSSLPLTGVMMERLARDLGNVRIFSGHSGVESQSGKVVAVLKNRVTVTSGDGAVPGSAAPGIVAFEYAAGGALPPAKHFFDIPVEFPAPIHAVDWQTGEPDSLTLIVTSRPTLLYRQLFSPSFEHSGAVVERILIAVAALFGLLEAVAFFMALRLSQTITHSVDGLYRATMEMHRGNLEHRIPVKRADQLAALSRSFNRMAASLGQLLVEQHEKQRMENELAIAREVQANLFPSREISLSSLEVYGACHAARSVSGDYYDFLSLGRSRIFLALGDISGKGISAALLMATLHAAVRAYRFAGEQLENGKLPAAAEDGSSPDESSSGLFRSPGKLLELLNHHLYQSSQPEKYATLFLAYYEADANRLTYSNGGHIPPILLSASGGIRRLDCGGTVVGLIDNMRYQEDTVQMESGDLLIAYSDGISEAENASGEFGEDRLLDVVAGNRSYPLKAISDEVFKALRAWIGEREQADDITVVLARRPTPSC